MIGASPFLTRWSSPQMAEIRIDPGFFGFGGDGCAWADGAAITVAAAAASPDFRRVLRECVCGVSM